MEMKRIETPNAACDTIKSNEAYEWT